MCMFSYSESEQQDRQIFKFVKDQKVWHIFLSIGGCAHACSLLIGTIGERYGFGKITLLRVIPTLASCNLAFWIGVIVWRFELVLQSGLCYWSYNLAFWIGVILWTWLLKLQYGVLNSCYNLAFCIGVLNWCSNLALWIGVVIWRFELAL